MGSEKLKPIFYPSTCKCKCQGTKFGPIIFISLINDASENAITHSSKYVNDLSLAEVRPANLPSNIDADVQDLDVWANNNHLKLNP